MFPTENGGGEIDEWINFTPTEQWNDVWADSTADTRANKKNFAICEN